jgi:hypothetical protein
VPGTRRELKSWQTKGGIRAMFGYTREIPNQWPRLRGLDTWILSLTGLLLLPTAVVRPLNQTL